MLPAIKRALTVTATSLRAVAAMPLPGTLVVTFCDQLLPVSACVMVPLFV